LRRTITWAALGTGIAIWLTFVHGQTPLLAKRALLGLTLGALAGALGGVVVYVPEYLHDPQLTGDDLNALLVAAFAVSGGLVGVLLGALWIPRNVGAGLVAGAAAGALVRLVWNQVNWDTGSALQESLQIGIQCLLIVGLILGALQLLGARQPSTLEPAR
jgi:uncharacterized membrane protein